MTTNVTGETLGGGVNLDEVQEDRELHELAALSTKELEDLIFNNAEDVTVSTPDNIVDPPAPKETAEDTVEGEETGDVADKISKILEEEAAATGKQSATVPLAALQDERAKARAKEEENQQLREQAAFLAGQLEALKNAPQGTANRESPDNATQDPLAVIDATIVNLNNQMKNKKYELSTQFDEAKISYTEMLKQIDDVEREYNQKVYPLIEHRRGIVESRTQPAPSEEAIKLGMERVLSDPWLVEQTQLLKQKNPWLDSVPEGLFEELKNKAQDALERSGRVLDATPESIMALRHKIAEIGNAWGLGAIASTPATQSSATPTAEQRQAKLKLAATHPPSIGKTGTAGHADDLAAKLASDKVTSAEIASELSTATIEKILGVA